jgi:hypothetical protein
MNPGEKANRIAKGNAYVFADEFVYAPNALLPQYVVHIKGGNLETGFYVVDFRDSIKIACDQIQRRYSPEAAKVLQLSVETRNFMRQKIADFYQRVPDEDAALLAS